MVEVEASRVTAPRYGVFSGLNSEASTDLLMLTASSSNSVLGAPAYEGINPIVSFRNQNRL